MIHNILHEARSFISSKFRYVFCLSWMFASILGLHTGNSLANVLPGTAYINITHEGIVLRFFIILLPVALTIFFQLLHLQWLQIIVFAVKSYLFSAVYSFISLFFSRASWMMLFLILFVDAAIHVAALFYLFCTDGYSTSFPKRKAALFVAFSILVYVLDVFLISPILEKLIYKL